MRQRSLAGCLALIALAFAVPASAAGAPVPLAQVGSLGSAAGQLSSPRGLAVDGAGNLYVADAANQRISVFGPDGTFIHAFGWGVDTGASAFQICTAASTCQSGLSGGGAGQLSNPQAVALDGTGGLYVTDQGNARISVFDTTGPSFIRAFGWDVADPDGGTAFEVCPTDGACRAGDLGGGAGQLSFPGGLTLDGAGNLYVADSGNTGSASSTVPGPRSSARSAGTWRNPTVVQRSRSARRTGPAGRAIRAAAQGSSAARGAWSSTAPATSTSPRQSVAGSASSTPRGPPSLGLSAGASPRVR